MLLYRRIIFFSILWSICWCAKAQQLSVSSFKCNPTDLDARVDFPVRDHNGKTCALIKVENTNTGFHFESILSIPKVEQKVGEIWVYVEPGVRKMTIKHQNLGILRDYYFPEPLKEATVYVMKLETIQINTTPNNATERMNFLSQYEKLDAKTLYETGDKYYKEKNYTKAVEYFQKAAEQGYAEAQFNLGHCYAKGRGVQKDDIQAVKWYQKAAEQGDATAQNNLGSCYANGQGVQKDDKQAVKWYQKAAEQGFAVAQYNLGVHYDFGQGVQKDDKQAVKWYQKAAEEGFAAAQNNLGYCYEFGQGVQKDDKQAVKWYQKAAEQGYAGAQYNLGRCYKNGQGVQKDGKQAVKWYQKAAEQGFAAAQNNLGLCYANGQGVQKDDKQAVKWYQKAAEQGFAAAQYNLAILQKKHITTLTTTSGNTATQKGTKNTTAKQTTTNIVKSNINKTPQTSKKNIETIPSQKRIALIIGNSDYQNGRLINPANDAADLTKKFKSLGFETTGRTNKDRRGLRDEISNFCDKAKNYDAAIFYYAGHAIQDKGINYLVPISATIEKPADIEYECINMNWVLRSMEEAGIKTKIIILDACRNNPVVQSWERSFTTSGLTNMSGVPVGTYLVFATQAGKVAKDGVGQRNSPYTKALLEMLDVPGLPVHELFHEVKKLVAKQTNQEQVPSETNSLLGDFIINAQ